MRLLLIIPTYASYRAFLRQLSEQGLAHGHEVAVACGTMTDHDAAETCNRAGSARVQFHRLTLPRGMNPVSHLRAATALRQFIRTWKPDVVHAHFSAAIFTTSLALRKSDPWKSLATFQGLIFPLAQGVRRFLFKELESWSARRFDRVHVLTSDDLAALRQTSPTANVELQHGYGFGCEDRFLDTPLPDPAAKMALRAEVGIPESAGVWIFVGRLTAFKGFDLVVRAFWEVRRTQTNLHLLVIGEKDPIHPTGLTPQEMARYTSDPFIVRTGWQSDVLPWLDRSDVMVFPSEREGMPVCVMEALARGLPVVACRVRGCRELIEDGKTGFFLSTRSLSAVVERLRALPLPLAPGTAAQPSRRTRWVNETWAFYETL